MKKIKCPKCGEVINLDEKDYNDILIQVRTEAFDEEVAKRRAELEYSFNEKYQDLVRIKDADNNKIVEELKQKISTMQSENAINSLNKEKELKEFYEAKLNEFKEESIKLNAKIAQQDILTEAAITKASADMRLEVNDLKNQLILKDQQQELKDQQNKDFLANALKMKDEEIERLKDFKAKLSTKGVGESLEVYCHNKFDEIRNVAYPYCYFEKDNKTSESGSKGDFIFKDYVDGTEYISIMFEMKNESDTTATKHCNEDFFKELDKDRREKNCEYAILVSALEADSDLYNAGIVDVSHRYPKMFVVRPQCFLSIIALLTSAAKNTVEAKKEVLALKQENIDVTNFEEKLLDVQAKFNTNYGCAQKHFETTIKTIDETIAKLTKIKDELTTTGNQLRLANDKLQDVSIKKLTANNPTMKAKFAEAK